MVLQLEEGEDHRSQPAVVEEEQHSGPEEAARSPEELGVLHSLGAAVQEQQHPRRPAESGSETHLVELVNESLKVSKFCRHTLCPVASKRRHNTVNVQLLNQVPHVEASMLH